MTNLPKSYPTSSLLMAKVIAGIASAVNGPNSSGEPCENKFYREGISFFLNEESSIMDMERLKETLEKAIEFSRENKRNTE